MTTRRSYRSTRLRFAPGGYIPQAGETIIMFRDSSGRAVAVTVHHIKQTFEHSDESGVILMDATVSFHDIANWREVFGDDDEEGGGA